MANDGKDGNQGEPQPRQQPALSDKAIEQAKNMLLHGVGYKRPPRHARFRKGQSGNPKGRPKSSASGMGSRSADALVLKEAERLIAMREGEDIKEVSAIEAVLRAQYVSAVKGSAYAQKHVIERYERAECERRRQIEEDVAFWKDYVEAKRAAIAEAEHRGDSLPDPLPHPDDVVIDREHGVQLIGPLCEGDVKQIEEACRMRDVLIMQDALDACMWDEPSIARPWTRLSSSGAFKRAAMPTSGRSKSIPIAIWSG